jgi:peroxiredoxin family protein
MITFWQAMALISTAATILGVFLAVYGMINNKTLKKESALTREAIQSNMEAIKSEARLTREMIQSENRSTREMIQSENRSTREMIQSEDRSTREMIRETTKYIADLIASGKRGLAGGQA